MLEMVTESNVTVVLVECVCRMKRDPYDELWLTRRLI